jgi:hypothetical protein
MVPKKIGTFAIAIFRLESKLSDEYGRLMKE